MRGYYGGDPIAVQAMANLPMWSQP